MIYTLAPEKQIGWVEPLGPAARAMLPARSAALPVVGRITGANTPAAQKLRELHPDVIVDVGNVDARYAALADRIEKETGIPYLLFDGSLAKSAATYRALGAILGEKARADGLARDADRLLAGVAKPAPGGHKLRVYYARLDGGLTAPAPRSSTTEIFAAVGAEVMPVAADKHGMVKHTLDEIIAWQPDVVLAYEPAIYAAIKADPQWQEIPAVRAGRVYLAPNVPFSWIDEPPGVNRLIGLPWLAGVLSTGEPPATMKTAARLFYRRFYHVRLAPAQLDQVLSPRAAQ